jgi:hypothetical protein
MKFTKLSGAQRQTYIDELKQTKNMEEFMIILCTRFDMKNANPGTITKSILASQMINTVMPMINPEIK